MKSLHTYNKIRIIAIILLIIVSINALAAGYSFIVDPTGAGLGITTDYLRPSAPFHTYIVPGIVLFAINGVVSSIIAVMAITRHQHYSLFIFLQGGIFVGWIGIQLLVVTDFHPLHLIIAIIGMILMLLGGKLMNVERSLTA